MPEHDLPPELEELRRRADSAFDTLRTDLMRAYELPIPEFAGPTPEELTEAAKDSKASKELRAVATLVEQKKFSWDDVLRGRADAVPEVGALQAFGSNRLTKLLEDGVEEPEPEPEPEAPPKPTRRGDDGNGSVMRDAW